MIAGVEIDVKREPEDNKGSERTRSVTVNPAIYNLSWCVSCIMVPWEILSIHIAVDAIEKNPDSWRQTENTKTVCGRNF